MTRTYNYLVNGQLPTTLLGESGPITPRKSPLPTMN